MMTQIERLMEDKKEKRLLNVENKITLLRKEESYDTIHGVLNISCSNGNAASFNTIENREKAIDKGKYNLYYGYSPKFDCNLWSLHTIDRSGIRIHWANRGSELSGCIAVGLYRYYDYIAESKKAIEILHKVLDKNRLYEIKII